MGAQVCIQCHQSEGRAWAGSHHDLAMQEATPSTVLADFANERLITEDDTTEFLRTGDDFLLRARGPGGVRREFSVAYTFGVFPLQQYLVTLPGNRLQAFTGAWDTRPGNEGGQRWYTLYPHEQARPGSPLHWARPTQTWNTGCAACHSTGVENAYDAASDAFTTTFADEDVSCEACHGPGSLHAATAPQGNPVDLPVRLGRDVDVWTRAPGDATARRTSPLDSRAELESCAPCHSRRESTATAPRPEESFLDNYEPALLRQDLYHPDGQIDGEVYVYGSFVQSRMFEAGVTCSDCHEPHDLSLRATGNDLCARCHDAETFASAAHHLHAPTSPGGECVACHMPTKTYMGVDARRDHGLRVPRPDVSAALGTPNPCAACHDEPAEWAATALARQHGSREPGLHFAQTIQGGRVGDPAAFPGLEELAADSSRPAILRGTALALMANYIRDSVPRAVRQGLSDPEPLVRLGALDALRGWPPEAAIPLASPLLDDRWRAIRIRAARLLAPVLATETPSASREGEAPAWAEVEEAHRANAGRSDAWIRWADLALARGRPGEAEAALMRAIALDSLDLGAWTNLADLQRATSRDDQAGRTLSRARALLPEAPEIQHALALQRIRRGDMDGALPLLRDASAGAPENPRFGYVYAVAISSTGDTTGAVSLLERIAERHPFDPDVLSALAGYHQAQGNTERAAHFIRRLSQVVPDDAGVQAMLNDARGNDPEP